MTPKNKINMATLFIVLTQVVYFFLNFRLSCLCLRRLEFFFSPKISYTQKALAAVLLVASYYRRLAMQEEHVAAHFMFSFKKVY